MLASEADACRRVSSWRRHVFGELREVGAAADRSRGTRRAAQVHGAARTTEHAAAAFQHLGSADQGIHPGRGRSFGAEAIGERVRTGNAKVGSGLHREQHERARLGLAVPLLDPVHGVPVTHQHRVHQVAQQPLGQLGVGAVGREEVAQGTENAVTELVAGAKQRGRAGGETDAIALQLFQRLTPGRHLGQRFLGLARHGALRRFTLPGSREEMARLFGLRLCLLRVARARRRDVRGLARAALGLGQLGLEGLALRGGDLGPLAERRQLAIERAPLAFERAQRLGLHGQLLLHAADLLALGLELQTRVVSSVSERPASSSWTC